MEKALTKQLAKKQKALALNMAALKAGFDYAQATFEKRDPFVAERMHATDGKILIEGNTAAAIGCLMAGVTVVAWYPITPSSSLCESLIDLMRKYRIDKETGKATFAIVQAEDEIAALGMVIGASWAGARAMTSTSGPGISLMGEFTGLGYYAEIPAVIFDIQRVGPVHGPADADGAGRHPVDGAAVARRHPSPDAAALVGRRVLRDGDCRVRSVGAAADAGVRDVGSRPRHEHLDGRSVPVSRRRRSIAARCWTKSELARARRVGPLQGRGRRRHPVAHAAGHEHAGLLRARIGPQREGPVQRARRRLPAEHGAAGAQVRDRALAGADARGRCSRRAPASGSSPTAPATGRSSRAAISSATKRPSRPRICG